MSNSYSLVLIFLVVILISLFIGLIVYFIYNSLKGYTQTDIIMESRYLKNNPGYISYSDLPISELNCDGEYEVHYSMWLYVNDLNYNLGYVKPILNRGKQLTLNNSEYSRSSLLNDYNSCPGIFLDEKQNNLIICVDLLNTETSETVTKHYYVNNIPMKNWFHVGFNIDHQYLNIFYNGKLMKSYTFDPLFRPNFNSLHSLHIGEKGGMDGYICKLMYRSENITLDELEHIYMSGPIDLSEGCPNTTEVMEDGLYDTYKTDSGSIDYDDYYYDINYGRYIIKPNDLTSTESLQKQISDLQNQLGIINLQTNASQPVASNSTELNELMNNNNNNKASNNLADIGTNFNF